MKLSRIDTHGMYINVRKGWIFQFTFFWRSYAPFLNITIWVYSKFLWTQLLLQFSVDNSETFQDWHPWYVVVLKGWIFQFVYFQRSYAPFLNISIWVYSKFLWTQLLLQFSVDYSETTPMVCSCAQKSRSSIEPKLKKTSLGIFWLKD